MCVPAPAPPPLVAAERAPRATRKTPTRGSRRLLARVENADAGEPDVFATLKKKQEAVDATRSWRSGKAARRTTGGVERTTAGVERTSNNNAPRLDASGTRARGDLGVFDDAVRGDVDARGVFGSTVHGGAAHDRASRSARADIDIVGVRARA